MPPAMRQIIVDRYRIPGTNEVSYFQLMRDVEGFAVPMTARPATRPPGELIAAPKAAHEIDPKGLVDQISASFFRTRVRPLEFFRDFDPLRKGEVTKAVRCLFKNFRCGRGLNNIDGCFKII